jgi:hypothetical protein
MSDRTDTIPLPAHEARCEPAACTMRARCARRLAAVPPHATMKSAESWVAGGTALCVGFVDAAGLRKQVMAPPVRRVHPPLGSA